MALLNSKLADWFFRLGSTNAAVSHYQLYNLPAPEFDESDGDDDVLRSVEALIVHQKPEEAFQLMEPLLEISPFPRTVMACMVRIVERIIEIEQVRAEIARAERSSLDPKAQPLQDLLDRVLFHMAGLTDEEAKGVEERLAKML